MAATEQAEVINLNVFTLIKMRQYYHKKISIANLEIDLKGGGLCPPPILFCLRLLIVRRTSWSQMSIVLPKLDTGSD